MSRFTFVATLSLDLDRTLVDTPIRLTCSDAVKSIWSLHQEKAFGLVSLGRLIVRIDTSDYVNTPVPLFVYSKWHGMWIRTPSLTRFLNEPIRAHWVDIDEGWHKPSDGLLYPPRNRGPYLEKFWS